MKNSKRVNSIIQLIAAIFILVFLYTAIEKIRYPAVFAGSMQQSPLLGPYGKILVWLIPGVEMLAVVLLIIPGTRFLALTLSTFLMILFTSYIAYMLMFRSNLPCSCGGILAAMSWKTHLIFNISLMLLGVYGIILSKRYKWFIPIKPEYTSRISK
jgi:Methylamine utilisation protein MauE